MIYNYKDYYKIILKLSNVYNKKFRKIEKEELVSEGNVIFCKAIKDFKDDRSKFSTYFYHRLKWGLNIYCKNYYKRYLGYGDINDDFEKVDTAKYAKKEVLKITDLFLDLSKEAKDMINNIFNPDSNLKLTNTNHNNYKYYDYKKTNVTKSTLMEYYTKRNMKRKEVYNIFNEITNLCCELN